MNQIFGDFIDDLCTNIDFLFLRLSTNYTSLKKCWENNSLSANFMSDYLTMYFLINEEKNFATSQRSEIKSTVSYIANELLENATKFSDESSHYPINITLHLHSNKIVFISTNSVSPQTVETFQEFLKELTTSTPGEFYIRQLEKNAEDELMNPSRLGFVTMMNDYLAKLGWKSETIQQDPEMITVTTMVQLII